MTKAARFKVLKDHALGKFRMYCDNKPVGEPYDLKREAVAAMVRAIAA
jgi:hypothetical protein